MKPQLKIPQETLDKLIQSRDRNDTLIGLNYLKEFSYEELITVLPSGEYKSRGFNVAIKNDKEYIDTYYMLNDNLLVYFNKGHEGKLELIFRKKSMYFNRSWKIIEL